MNTPALVRRAACGVRRRPPHGGLWWFWWVRLWSWRAAARELFRTPLKPAVITLAWAVLVAGLYALAYRGIRFIYEASGVGPFMLSRLWFLLLFVIMILLAISQIASAYSTLVRSPETRYWMSLPVCARTLARAKWLESSFYSSWAVALLLVPLCLACLQVLTAPLWVMGWIGALLFPLVGIATSMATLLLLVWLRWVPRVVVRRELIPCGFVLACGAFFWLLGEQPRDPGQDAWFVALQALLPRMHIAMSMWWPSSWMATALDAGLHGRWTEGVRYAALLWTTMVVSWRILDHSAARLLLPVLRRHAQPMMDDTEQVGRMTGLRMPWWTRHPWSAALAKDVFLVVRDPMQWSQAVVFFGLLGAYFGNIHRLATLSVEPAWRVGVASLNVASTLLVLGSLCVRFVFPQMSLEGRSLWLLRLTPHGTYHVLRSKLCLYGVLAIGIVGGLLWLSASRLGVSLGVRWWLLGVGTVAAVTIVGLTVGLGAYWIDPAAQDAARLVSSSKGALVLVCMLGYVACVVAALVTAWTRWTTGASVPLVLACLGLLLVSALTWWFPVRLGLAKLAHLEDSA